jgi:hypothetical protein
VVVLTHVLHLARASCLAVIFLDEGVASESWRLQALFPPSFLFELYALKNCVILLMDICFLFLGHSPVQCVIDLACGNVGALACAQCAYFWR